MCVLYVLDRKSHITSCHASNVTLYLACRSSDPVNARQIKSRTGLYY